MIDAEKSKQIFNEIQELFEKHNLTNAEELYIINECKSILFMNRVFSILERNSK